MRIVSLLPGNTEMACALGLESALVARSHECDYPPAITDRPVATASRIDPCQPQGRINEAVRQVGAEGRGLYALDEDLLADLRPDLILTQKKCEVCAVDYDDVVEVCRRLWPDGPPDILSFQPNSIWDMLADLHTIARAANVADTGRRLVRQLLDRISRVQERVAEIPLENRPTVVFLEWVDPPMTCGGWQPEMIRLAGGRCLISIPGEKAAWTTPEAIAEAAPDVLLLGACGMSVEAMKAVVEALKQHAWFGGLPAVRDGRAWIVDGNSYFNRPGPRLVDSLEMLADLFTDTVLDRWRPDQLLQISGK